MSDARFADGLRYRLEIPSVEGPRVFRAVLDEADRRGLDVRRISQGSGVMMLTDPELREMAELGAANGVEVSLFIGPRGAWDTGGQSFDAETAGALKDVYQGLGSRVGRREKPREVTSAFVAAGALLLVGAVGAAMVVAPRLP